MNAIREQFDSSVPPSSERGITLPAPTVNVRLLDLLLRHRHFLLRAENGLARDVVAVFRAAQRTIRDELGGIGARTGVTAINELRRQRLTALERRLDEILGLAQSEGEGLFNTRLRQLAEREAQIQASIIKRAVPGRIAAAMGLDLAGPDIERVLAILEEPLGGVRFADRLRRNFGETTSAMRRNLATSVALGEGMPEAARRLTTTVGKLSMNRAVVIARSEIQRVANSTARHLYTRNQGVIKGLQVVETLDKRTCLICAGRDGNVVPVDAPASEVPLFHAMCRGIVAPVTRSFRELGLSRDEFPASTRASLDGQVPGPVTYEDWFKRQDAAFQREVLGPARFELFKSGEVRITDFARDNRILSIDELPTAA